PTQPTAAARLAANASNSQRTRMRCPWLPVIGISFGGRLANISLAQGVRERPVAVTARGCDGTREPWVPRGRLHTRRGRAEVPIRDEAARVAAPLFESIRCA